LWIFDNRAESFPIVPNRSESFPIVPIRAGSWRLVPSRVESRLAWTKENQPQDDYRMAPLDS
jgi:hypothetical protein